MGIRWGRGLGRSADLVVIVVVGGATALAAQSRSSPIAVTDGADPLSAWARWLATVVNFVKLIEAVVLVAGVYQLWARRDERRRADEEAARMAVKSANYQAWQVLNSAQGKGGSGGRVDALSDLIRNSVSLAGVRLDGAWLENARLAGGQFSRASFRQANLKGADFRDANLDDVDFTDAILTGADFRGAHLRHAVLAGAHLGTADLRGADLTGIRGWEQIGRASYLNVEGVRGAPAGFRERMIASGAVDGATEGTPLNLEDTFSTVWRAV